MRDALYAYLSTHRNLLKRKQEKRLPDSFSRKKGSIENGDCQGSGDCETVQI
jgi:hypothetical protein